MTAPRPQPIHRVAPAWRRREPWHRVAFAAAALVVAAFYAWTCAGNTADWSFGPKQHDYYTLLVDGFRAGQLNLKVEVPAELLAISNPYPPANRPAELGLHDASFFRGKYYLYFGVAPAVTLLLPFRLITGIDLPLPVAVTVFAYGGFLASAAAWWHVRRRFFPEASVGLTVLTLLVLATVSMGPILVRRGNVWELPLGSGYCFAMLAVAALTRAMLPSSERTPATLQAPGVSPGWLAAAAAALGLAIASRPTYVFALGLLAVPLGAAWWQWWRTAPRRAAAPWRATLAASVTLALLGAALAWHNYARFGDPLEFGVRYQFTSIHEAEARHFSASYLAFNLRGYFFAVAEWTRYFPWIHAPVAPPLPAGYFGLEEVYGLLTNVPVVWLAALAPLAARGLWPETEKSMRILVAAVASLACGPILALVFFYASMARYQADFAPALAWLAGLGLLALGRWSRERRGWKRKLPVVVAGAAGAFSIAFALVLSVVLYGDLRRARPETYDRLARVANRPVAWLERMAGVPTGPLECRVQFPRGTPGTHEPLVTLGPAGEADRVFVVYEDAGWIRIGFSRVGGGVRLSRRVAVDPRQDYRLRVEAGSLLRPEAAPGRAKLAPRIQPADRLLVRLDDQVLIEENFRFSPVSAGAVAVGHDPWSRPPLRFAGRISDVTRAGSGSGGAPELLRHERLQIVVDAAAVAPRQPLCTIGEGPAAVVWFLGFRENGRVTLGCAGAGGIRWESEPVDGARRFAHEVELLAVTDPAQPDGRGETIVKLNGQVLGSPRGVAGARASPVVLGRSAVPSFAGADVIEGRVRPSPRLADGAEDDAFDAMELELRLVPAAPGTREPLVVTGVPGRADFLFVEHVGEGRLRLGFEHWGKAPIFSAPFGLDFAADHRLEVALGSFPSARRSPGYRPTGQLEVWLNGARLWEAAARFFPVSAAEVAVGHNPVGGTACAPAFSGAVLGLKRIRRSRLGPGARRRHRSNRHGVGS